MGERRANEIYIYRNGIENNATGNKVNENKGLSVIVNRYCPKFEQYECYGIYSDHIAPVPPVVSTENGHYSFFVQHYRAWLSFVPFLSDPVRSPLDTTN